MRVTFQLLLAFTPVGCGAPPAAPPTVRVAAAASLKPPLEEIAAAYRADNPGVVVTVSYGASGTFVAQITHGGPFDLFLSADADYPRKLADAGLTAPDGVFRFARGRLVVWTPAGSAVPLDAAGLPALADPSVRRLALANPRHAPYGKAAEEALTRAGVWERVRGKVVYGENVEQAAGMLHAGAADAGFVPLSLATSPALAGGRAWPVPPDLHPPLDHVGGVLASAADPVAAAGLRAFLTGPRGRAVLTAHGFDPPPD